MQKSLEILVEKACKISHLYLLLLLVESSNFTDISDISLST